MDKRDRRRASAYAHPVQGLLCAHGHADEALRLLPVEPIYAAIGIWRTTVSFEWQATHTTCCRAAVSGGIAVQGVALRRLTFFVENVLARLRRSGEYELEIQVQHDPWCGYGNPHEEERRQRSTSRRGGRRRG